MQKQMNNLTEQQLRFYTLKTENGSEESAIRGIIRCGWTHTKIAEEVGIFYTTVRRYQIWQFSPVHGSRTRPGKVRLEPVQ